MLPQNSHRRADAPKHRLHLISYAKRRATSPCSTYSVLFTITMAFSGARFTIEKKIGMEEHAFRLMCMEAGMGRLTWCLMLEKRVMNMTLAGSRLMRPPQSVVALRGLRCYWVN
jgi:hypothetical protein